MPGLITDNRSPARGCGNGIILGLIFWTAIAALIWWGVFR